MVVLGMARKNIAGQWNDRRDEIIVTPTVWYDNVFRSDYRLRPLSEVNA